MNPAFTSILEIHRIVNSEKKKHFLLSFVTFHFEIEKSLHRDPEINIVFFIKNTDICPIESFFLCDFI